MPTPTHDPIAASEQAPLLRILRIQAHANRLMNHRLHQAMEPLTALELQAPRVGFFPSLLATLNHVLEVDGYYVGALAGDDVSTHWDRFRPAAALAELAARQRAVDERLIAFCNRLDAAGCDRVVGLPRSAGRVQRERVVHVLAHLHMHQIHHRGQVHAMLSGTAVAPPQLDEFLMPSEGHLRRVEMAALGWDEAAIYGTPP
jgi:uncharacterized damage-inducible protein DinB